MALGDGSLEILFSYWQKENKVLILLHSQSTGDPFVDI
jgi:hypothetical protein